MLRAVCWLGLEGRVTRSALRRERALSWSALHRHLMRLTHIGAVLADGRWPRRTVLLTDAGLATIAAALDAKPSANARAER